MSANKNRRQLKNYIINRDVQLKMALTNLALLGLVVAIIIITVLSPFYQDALTANTLWEQNFSARYFVAVLDRLIVTMAVLLVVIFCHQIIFTHRFCGPLINFRHSFKRITQRDLTRKVYLRKGDFLKQEATQVNEMMDSLADTLSAIKQSNDNVLEALKAYKQSLGGAQRSNQILKLAEQQAILCHQQLSQFRLNPQPNQVEGETSQEESFSHSPKSSLDSGGLI
jgi:methyl-accepting chemotaxis protein